MSFAMKQMYSAKMYFFFFFFPMSCQFDREHFNEVFVDLKWFESKVGNKYLNEAAGLAAEKEAASKDARKNEVGTSTENMHCVFQHCFHVCLFPVIDFLKKISVGFCSLSGFPDYIRESHRRGKSSSGSR